VTTDKYSRVERERRFLLAAIPTGTCIRRADIVDRYVEGTRLRLRRSREQFADRTSTVRKLTQKMPAPSGGPGLITTIYVDQVEYDHLAQLPGTELRKTRYSVPPLGIDVFTGVLAGLVIGEVEFQTDDELASFAEPPESAGEVTFDGRFSGGRLVSTSRKEMLTLLTEFGLEPLEVAREWRVH
jgi:hypothetical protein